MYSVLLWNACHHYNFAVYRRVNQAIVAARIQPGLLNGCCPLGQKGSCLLLPSNTVHCSTYPWQCYETVSRISHEKIAAEEQPVVQAHSHPHPTKKINFFVWKHQKSRLANLKMRNCSGLFRSYPLRCVSANSNSGHFVNVRRPMLWRIMHMNSQKQHCDEVKGTSTAYLRSECDLLFLEQNPVFNCKEAFSWHRLFCISPQAAVCVFLQKDMFLVQTSWRHAMNWPIQVLWNCQKSGAFGPRGVLIHSTFLGCMLRFIKILNPALHFLNSICV